MWIGVERLLLAWMGVALVLAGLAAFSHLKIADVVDRAPTHRNRSASHA